MSKPRVLVLGGVGFIGRNFVEYLVKNDLCSKIRVADKMIPALASFSPEHKELFEKSIEFKQVNLSRPSTIAKVFDDESGGYDYVVNLAGETKYSQNEAVYKENIIDVLVTSAKEAANRGVKRYIEVSTAQVYESSSKASNEKSKLKPWTGIAKAKLAAEEELSKIPNLDYVILRPAIVYGNGDQTGVMPRIIAACIYKHNGEKMEFLWDKGLKMNTVHVSDVCGAIWHATTHGKKGDIYNLADENDTNQGSVAELLESLFGIKTAFVGNLKSKVATGVSMKFVADAANDKHLKPWSDILKANNINSTPLTPYLDEELLFDNDLAVDGKAITSTGFVYKHPKMTVQDLRAEVEYFVKSGYFPGSML